MAGYGALSEAYEWLIRDEHLSPDGSVARFEDLVTPLPPNARVLDCSCGTGQLAVGLAGHGLDVVATDASAGMIRRTAALADEHGVRLDARQVSWEDLTGQLEASTFDLVFCVGNSLGHAEGSRGRLAALASMARLLRPDGRLVLTSRMWEVVRARGSRIDVRDHLIRRDGRDAVVIYHTQIAPDWEQEHHFEIAVTEVRPDGSLHTCAERLSFWPYRYEELVAQLQSVGLTVETTTVDADGAGYLLVARSNRRSVNKTGLPVSRA
ncbi:methyltransferase domain-containing protein [Nocardioides sp. NBC_00368]|uniref:class I SAM-dependent methyltransferase n=1 Tax=Nocardioides sp. NBC_00368 TaxID=2976000 RepID=UPI002E1EC3DD